MPVSCLVTRSGGPDVLAIRDVPSRPLKPGQVRIAVRFAGINFADLAARAGLYGPAPKPPFAPGFEVSGEIVETAEGAMGLAQGDLVLAVTRFGGYSSEVVADAARARRLPQGMSLEEGAALPAVYLTAYHGLTQVARMREGESTLIHACAGGVGTAMVQLAKRLKITSYGTASSEEKLSFAKSHGLDFGVNYGEKDFEEEVLRLSSGRGVDAAFDANGGESFAKSYRCLAPGGRLVVYGAAGLMPGGPLGLARTVWRLARQKRFSGLDLIERNAGVLGFQVLLLWDQLELLGREMDDLLAFYREGAIRPYVEKAYPLAQAGEAHRYLLSRRSRGKLLLEMPRP